MCVGALPKFLVCKRLVLISKTFYSFYPLLRGKKFYGSSILIAKGSCFSTTTGKLFANGLSPKVVPPNQSVILRRCLYAPNFSMRFACASAIGINSYAGKRGPNPPARQARSPNSAIQSGRHRSEYIIVGTGCQL